MEFFETIKERKSTRAFLEKKVEEEKLQKILEAINLAPSARNLQSYEIVVIRDSKTREKLRDSTNGQEHVLQAPLVLAFYANKEHSQGILKMRKAKGHGERGKKLYCVQDATIACAYAQLAATALGLASVWVGAFDPEKVKEILGGSEDIEPIALLPIGYAAEKPERKARRELADLVHLEKL